MPVIFNSPVRGGSASALALRPARRFSAIAFALSVVAAMFTVAAAEPMVRLVATASNEREAAAAVEHVGGRVESAVPLVDGVVAQVPSSRVADLSRLVQVTADRTLHVRSASFEAAPETAYPYEVGAVDAWSRAAGEGVGVALVDTGVAPVPDLLDRVAAVADLTPERSFTDGFGHGTFMAGLIAGDGTSSEGRYVGVAPGAHLVSVKVAVSDGSTTLGTVLNGLQLVRHSRERFNIRVVLLALSSGSTMAPERDPLTRALRALWNDGIFVVVPAGNDGPDDGSIDSPGLDPVLMTAGAVDDRGTPSVADDEVPFWTGRGPSPFGAAKPDVGAPGVHLVSTRAPGSTIDDQHPNARIGEGYFRGSGTSMSSAVTAGVAAVVLSAESKLSPDDLKGAMIAGATPLNVPATAVGSGVVNVGAAIDADGGPSAGDVANDHGNGRGSKHGFWDGRSWDGRLWDGRSWDGRAWDGRSWDGRAWDGRAWDGRAWDGRAWDGRMWDGRLWVAMTWG